MSDGLITAEPISVFRTIDRLAAAATAAGPAGVRRIDHAKDAHEAGLQLRPTELPIFGHARGGTSSSSNAIKPGAVGPAVEEASRFGPAGSVQQARAAMLR